MNLRTEVSLMPLCLPPFLLSWPRGSGVDLLLIMPVEELILTVMSDTI